jgi:hypothetical protein
MNNISIWSVLPWAGLASGFVLTILAFARYKEIGKLIGAGAGAIICNVVVLAGISGTALGALLFTGSAVLAAASSFAFVRDLKKRGRQEPGKSS